MDELYDDKAEQLVITGIINFMKTDSGRYLFKMVKDIHQLRLMELTYADKDNIFVCQGEARAYSDMMTQTLNIDYLVALRESKQDNSN